MRPQPRKWEWLTREDSASPTAALESIMLTAVIDTHDGLDFMSADIPKEGFEFNPYDP